MVKKKKHSLILPLKNHKSSYHKNHKIWDIKTWRNSVDPDQTAGAVRSRSTLVVEANSNDYSYWLFFFALKKTDVFVFVVVLVVDRAEN